jgi:hypothetical protein
MPISAPSTIEIGSTSTPRPGSTPTISSEKYAEPAITAPIDRSRFRVITTIDCATAAITRMAAVKKTLWMLLNVKKCWPVAANTMIRATKNARGPPMRASRENDQREDGLATACDRLKSSSILSAGDAHMSALNQA